MISGGAPRSTSIAFCRASDAMGLSGVLLGLALLVWLAFRGWSVLLLAPLAALSVRPDRGSEVPPRPSAGHARIALGIVQIT